MRDCLIDIIAPLFDPGLKRWILAFEPGRVVIQQAQDAYASSVLRADAVLVIVEAAAITIPLKCAAGLALDLIPKKFFARPLHAGLAQQPDIRVDLIRAHAVAHSRNHTKGSALVAPGQRLSCGAPGRD